MAAQGIRDGAVDLAFRGALGAARVLPWEARLALFAALAHRVVAPLAGWRERVRANLAHVWPDLPEDAVRRITREVAGNAGRTLAEFYHPQELRTRAARCRPHGPGLAAMAEAARTGRPAILVSGHFGNYQAVRIALAARGLKVAGLYRPMNNAAFNRHYVTVTRALVDAPLFARDRRGMAAMLRHLRQGGMVGMLIDQHFHEGAVLDFMGRPARTPLSAAELALRHDALLVPGYATRTGSGTSFDIEIEAPIPHDTPEAMTQAFNDSLARRVCAHPGQWLWIHRRWKGVGTVREA